MYNLIIRSLLEQKINRFARDVLTAVDKCYNYNISFNIGNYIKCEMDDSMMHVYVTTNKQFVTDGLDEDMLSELDENDCMLDTTTITYDIFVSPSHRELLTLAMTKDIMSELEEDYYGIIPKEILKITPDINMKGLRNYD